jgi:exosortase
MAVSTSPIRLPARADWPAQIASLLTLTALAVLTLPTLYSFATIFWARTRDTHAPVVLAFIVVAFWRERHALNWSATPRAVACAFGTALFGAVLYFLGRSQSFYQLEGLGLIIVIAAAILLIGGFHGLRRYLFPCFMLLFVIPVPGSIADHLLVPLKMVLSQAVTDMFYALGYPISNHGVILNVGFYQLQIADACAGLRSLISLSAIGLLFVYLLPPSRPIVTVLLLLMTPLLALIANFLRVAMLVMITYYFGGDVGASAHELAALSEIVIVLAFFVLTRLLFEAIFGSGDETRRA